MILSCNSCNKKFVVPDSAIGASGRLVQCSSCGNKWKQFPNISKPEKKIEIQKVVPISSKIKKIAKVKKRKVKKKSGPNLYTPEYLAKKHGIKINDEKNNDKKINLITNTNFGFYNFFITSSIIMIFFFRLLYFFQETIVENFPVTEIYIEYIFETIRNLKEIIQNFFSGY